MDLTSFRTDSAPAPAPELVEHPVLGHGEVLAFDQSITATGWIRLISGRGGLHVIEVGSISCPPDGYPKGHAGTLLRAEYVAKEMASILRRVPVLDVVHELPAVGGRMARPESSLLAALALRIEARRQGHGVHIVQNQHSKKVLVGNGNASKSEWHAGISKFTYSGPKPTNEGQRDAFCLGLTFLLDRGPE